MAGMQIAFGTDHVTPVTTALLEHLRAAGHEVNVIAYPDPWGSAGRRVGEEVAQGRAARGVVCCFTGTGVSIAANKVPGVRAALCADAQTAAGARRWNDANVLAIALRTTTETTGREILDAFLDPSIEVEESESVQIRHLDDHEVGR
jgi:ribose 5-phosphate isomerase B